MMNFNNAVKRLETQFLEDYNQVKEENKCIIIDIYRPRLEVYKLQLDKTTKEIIYDNHKR